MVGAPGSAAWLLGHELRLAWYGAAPNQGGRRRPRLALLTLLLLGWIGLHALAYALLHQHGGAALRAPYLAMTATVLIALGATFMLSTALGASVRALFERGDLDLLLSSPLAARSIFAVRLLGVAGATAAPYVYLFAPFAHVALVLGQPGWLGIYVVVCAGAMLATCAAMLLTLALVRLLGARRTRVVAQVIAGIAGALFFLLTQLYNLVEHTDTDGAGRAAALAQALAAAPLLDPASALWLAGRAAFGAPLPLSGAAVLALLAYGLTVGRTHGFFVHGLQQAAGSGRARPRLAGPLRLRFRTSLFDTIVLKEWRLVARDPHLISQVLLQLLYLLPLLFLILRGGAPGPAIGAGLTLLCSSLTGALAWIAVSAEDAPDLLLGSPAPARTVRLAKLAAATLPPMLVVALPLLWLLLRTPLAGLLVAFTTSAAVLGAALIVSWTGRPAPRSDFKLRGKANVLCSMLELVSSVCWAALGWLLLMLQDGVQADLPLALAGAAAALAGGLGVPFGAWLLRRRAV